MLKLRHLGAAVVKLVVGLFMDMKYTGILWAPTDGTRQPSGFHKLLLVS